MSTLIAIKENGVVVLGADSRWMSSDRRAIHSDSTPKLIQIRPDLFMGLTGMIEMCKVQLAKAYELAPHFPSVVDFARALYAACLPEFEVFARSLSRPDHISGEQPFAGLLLAGYVEGRQAEYVYIEVYCRNGHVECEGRASLTMPQSFMLTDGECIGPEMKADRDAGRIFTGDPVAFVRRVLKRQRELRPFVGGPDQILVIDRDGARWITEPPAFRLDWWPWPDCRPAEGHLNLQAAFGFNGSEFEVDPAEGFRVKGVDFSKGFHGFDVGTAAVPKITVRVGGEPIGWIGDDSAVSGYVGGWLKRLLVGGTSPADAKLFADASGNVVARGVYVNDAGSPLGWIGSNGVDSGAWFKKLGVGGSALVNAPLKADASGKLSIVATSSNAASTLLQMTLGDSSVLRIGNETADSAAAGYTHTNSLGNYLGLSPEAVRIGGSVGRLATFGSDGSGGGLSVRDPSTGVNAAVRADYSMGGLLETSTAAWNRNPLVLGGYHLWVDGGGNLRIKNGAPANDTDGTIVGTQS